MRNLFLNDKNILFLIILNAIVIFIGGFGNYFLINILDAVFTILFSLELFFKLKEYGKSYFKDGWNIFDFILIIISIPSLGVLIGYSFANLSPFLALRTLRVFKVFRFFKFVPNIDNILKSIKRAIKTSLLILVAFIIMIFSFSILNNYLYSEHEEFENPAISLYNTIKIFTVEGWNDVPEEMALEMDYGRGLLTKGYFTFVLILGGIFGLSFVNAILVDAMTMDNNEVLEEKIDKLEKKIDKLLMK